MIESNRRCQNQICASYVTSQDHDNVVLHAAQLAKKNCEEEKMLRSRLYVIIAEANQDTKYMQEGRPSELIADK